jgi:hypothetical protein
MKVQKSSGVSPFGGLNFVIEELDRSGIGELLSQQLPELSAQSRYVWRDIIYSFWSIFFCGGDCAEDLGGNLRAALSAHPDLSVPSPDRVLNRLKELAVQAKVFGTERSSIEHFFAVNDQLNFLNLSLCNRLFSLNKKSVTLDYDNTCCLTGKKDATRTYQFEQGYQPGVAFIGRQVVYVENRSGKSAAHVGQHETLLRMFTALKQHGITVGQFRADSATYGYKMINVIDRFSDRFYVRARMSQTLEKAITAIKTWQPIKKGDEIVYLGETTFTPFQRVVRDTNKANTLKTYRLVVVKEKRKDGQLNFFTGEACFYSAIITNDTQMEAQEIVHFYNQRGAIEREFEVLKHDFGWLKLPFSYLEQNNVYMLITAMCRNIYAHIIELFSKEVNGLQPHYRLKKFIFRFICIPAKWIRKARGWHLRLYGEVAFKT